jgi:hypothetical protein
MNQLNYSSSDSDDDDDVKVITGSPCFDIVCTVIIDDMLYDKKRNIVILLDEIIK